MKIIINIFGLGLSFYFGYKIIKKYGKELRNYANQVSNEWPIMPPFINYILGVIAFLVLIFLQIFYFFESFIGWIALLIIAPFFYLSINKPKIFNLLQVITFFLTIIFGVILFFSVDNSRDCIGKAFIQNYSVTYTTELVEQNWGEVTEMREVDIAHVTTGNRTLDFILERIFPFIYRILIGLILFLSIKLNSNIRKKFLSVTNSSNKIAK